MQAEQRDSSGADRASANKSKTNICRRGLLAAMVVAPIAALPAPPAAATSIDGDRYEFGKRSGQEQAMSSVARAWIDRWRAAGGDFAVMARRDGAERVVLRGMAEPSIWVPTDGGNPALKPHEWLTEREHQDGARKVLDALLTLVPGLEAAVFEIVGPGVLASVEQMA